MPPDRLPRPPGAVRSRALVIGCGNTLFGDDGVGPFVAETVDELALPGVLCLAVHELTPELAAHLACTDVAIFVDAVLTGTTVTCSPVPLGDHADDTIDHALTPTALLTLAQLAFGHAPPAWMVTVPGLDFELGHTLSPQARHGATEAQRLIASLV